MHKLFNEAVYDHSPDKVVRFDKKGIFYPKEGDKA